MDPRRRACRPATTLARGTVRGALCLCAMLAAACASRPVGEAVGGAEAAPVDEVASSIEAEPGANLAPCGGEPGGLPGVLGPVVGKSKETYTELTLERALDEIEHVGVVVSVDRDTSGEISGYSLFHGRSPGKPAGITDYHRRDVARPGSSSGKKR